ncbi:acyl-CoA dehydrogenase family protein [Actinomycetospora endophytica]|uniref:Acyl-CoA dehydrogenase family protein n=1 Tax=Actinomycetospora endophytica TaxID=2291215 RepID=A0ABS8PHI3_9PSEU|nr:acyl-CoA dehydrogenase family protein [Actinomycetospora endophytica]MCD2197629.1 acyl-CoA dehydrogenase family protein [Actinomycetospora endophytica]
MTVSRFVVDPAPPAHTLTNWQILAQVAERDLNVARLAEGHLDAATTVADLGGTAVTPGSLWGVWASDGASGSEIRGRWEAGSWRLSGAKAWCSGADRCTHALVTADAPDGDRLFAVDLSEPGFSRADDTWQGIGMRSCGTTAVRFDDVPARAVGEPGEYLWRPRFWHDAVGVAAVWFGGALGASGPLRARSDGGGDEHDAAHRGHIDAALGAAGAALREAAAAITDPGARAESILTARRRALRVRAVVEAAVETAVRSTGRATGPRPLAQDAVHARHVADLEVYVRQSHAERDLAALGRLATELDGATPRGLRL